MKNILTASPKTVGLAQLIEKRQTNDFLRRSPILLGWDYSFTNAKKKKKRMSKNNLGVLYCFVFNFLESVWDEL